MISTSTAEELRGIVGGEWFLDTPEDLATYSYDGFLPEFMPDGVIVPRSAQEGPWPGPRWICWRMAVRGGNRHSTQGLNELGNEISSTSQTVNLCNEERMLAGT